MRKLFFFILAFFTYSSFIIHNSSFVHADFAKAYQDYVYTTTLYKTAGNDFQIARSSYQTYRTLAAQNEALDKFRKVLKARNQVMSVYYDLLQEKMNFTPGLNTDRINTFNTIRLSEESWLADDQKKVDAATSLEDLNQISQEFDQRYSQMDTETKQAIGEIEMAKIAALKTKVDANLTALSDKVNQINQSREDTSFAARGLISARNKLELYSANFASARSSFYPTRTYNNKGIDLYAGQSQLSGAKQYLTETLTLFKEIINSITG